MKFVARVLAESGSPVASATVEMVGPDRAVATGKITGGSLSLDADPGPVWGLLIDKRPALAFVVAVTAETADLGELVLVPAGLDWPVFHAPDGRVYAAPHAARPAPAVARAVAATRGGVTFGGLVGSSANQLSKVATAKTGLSLTGATVTVRGLPTSTEDAIGLEFPTPEIVATATGLSELSFTLKPQSAADAPQAAPSGLTVPDVVGYTRELAERKLVTAGLLADVSAQVVSDAKGAGRVVRQLPKGGDPTTVNAVVRLFIGKRGS